jgi:AraC-like DNA-binding protein
LSAWIDAPPPDFRLLRFSSDMLPKHERFDLWRDVLTRKLLRMAVDPIDGAPFEADAMLRSQHGLTVAIGDTGPTIGHRTNEIISHDNDDLMLMANLKGKFVLDSETGQLPLLEGDATVVSCAERGRLIRPELGRMFCVRVGRDTMRSLVPDVDDRLGRHIPASCEPLRLLMTYASALWCDDYVATGPQLSRFVVEHLRDLTALTLGAQGDGAQAANAGGGRAAKLKAVKDSIETRIGPWEFSVEDVATEVGVSPRYVRKLLEAEGLSFSGYVTERRLERARGMLTSPRNATQTIAAIAYDVGFGDLSYFNRAFRRRFERTPSDIRAEYA